MPTKDPEPEDEEEEEAAAAASSGPEAAAAEAKSPKAAKAAAKASSKAAAAKAPAKDEESDDDEASDAAPTPPTPPMPQMKISQLLPMVVMLGLGKFDLDELGYRRHAEVLFVIVQVVCLGLLGLIHSKVSAMPEGGAKIHVPEVKQFGQVVTPSTEQSTKDYDSAKLKEQAKQAVMSFAILGGVYYKWGYLMPLVLQVLMTPVQLYESPLFQLHVLNGAVARPFPTPNPFGLPTAPEAPAAPAVAASAEERKKQ